MLKIKIKYMRGVKPIERFNTGDWIDLRAAETTFIKKDEMKFIPLGVAMELPEGYEALVAPRSSACKNFKIMMANSIGVIDESFKGDNDEWHFPAYAIEDTVINKNERICQFRIIEHQPLIQLVVVERLGNKDRNGLGSTGKV